MDGQGWDVHMVIDHYLIYLTVEHLRGLDSNLYVPLLMCLIQTEEIIWISLLTHPYNKNILCKTSWLYLFSLLHLGALWNADQFHLGKDVRFLLAAETVCSGSTAVILQRIMCQRHKSRKMTVVCLHRI